MQDANAPIRVPKIWASGAVSPYVNTIPLVSQIPSNPGRASWTDGFVPLNFQPVAAGGIPPFGGDENGVLQQISAGLQWEQAGGPNPYDSTFAGNIGGYPKGALIPSIITLGVWWLSTIENNTTDPEAGPSNNWLKITLGQFRIRLLTNTTFFVNGSSGNDANTGLTIGAPFQTIQRAFSVIQNAYDLNGFIATISIAAGTYAAGGSLNGAVPGSTGPNSITVVTTGVVVVNGVGTAFAANQAAMFALNSSQLTLTASTSGGIGAAISCAGGSRIDILGTLTFGACGTDHVIATTGGIVGYAAPENVTGGGQSHFRAHAAGIIRCNSVAVAVTGSPNFSTAYAIADEGGIIEGVGYTVTSGTPTGTRYTAITNGVINVGGGGPNVFPGNAAGSVASGGQYV